MATYYFDRALVCGIYENTSVGVLCSETETISPTDAPAEIVYLQLFESLGTEELLPAMMVDIENVVIEDDPSVWVRGGKKTVFITDERYRKGAYQRKP